jgi:ribosomal protein S18 acetylase RimI-like enzyme
MAVDHARLAGPADAEVVTRILTDAFRDDPMWGPWAFPEPSTRRGHRESVFRLLVDGVLQEALGSRSATVLRAFEQFEEARPTEPHHYLTLFGTDPAHRGRGEGQRLLRWNLDRIDAAGEPAYLEAEDGLVPLYERFGFRVLTRFELADGPTVNCMWRDAQPSEGFVIRAGRADDLDELRVIYRRASLSNAGDRDALLASPDALVWEGAELARGGTLVAVDREGRVVGFATVVRLDEGLELEDLFVDPAFMRRGIATALVAELAREAARSGADWIEVTANPHAAAFYDSAGCSPIGTATTRFGDAPRLRLVVEGRKVRVSC